MVSEKTWSLPANEISECSADSENQHKVRSSKLPVQSLQQPQGNPIRSRGAFCDIVAYSIMSSSLMFLKQSVVFEVLK